MYGNKLIGEVILYESKQGTSCRHQAKSGMSEPCCKQGN